MRKNISVSGLTLKQREKESEKIRKKYEKKGYQFIEYIEGGMTNSNNIFEVDESILKKEKSSLLIKIGVFFLLLAGLLYLIPGTEDQKIEDKVTYNSKEVTKFDFNEKWPFKNDIAILKCYQDEVAKMPVVIVGGRSYGLTGYADARYGQDDLKALNKVWAKNPKIKGTMIDLGPITKEALKLCD